MIWNSNGGQCVIKQKTKRSLAWRRIFFNNYINFPQVDQYWTCRWTNNKSRISFRILETIDYGTYIKDVMSTLIAHASVIFFYKSSSFTHIISLIIKYSNITNIVDTLYQRIQRESQNPKNKIPRILSLNNIKIIFLWDKISSRIII